MSKNTKDDLLALVVILGMGGSWLTVGACGAIGIIRGIQRGEYFTFGAGFVSLLVFLAMGATPFITKPPPEPQ